MEQSADDLCDDAIVCLCQKVTKEDIVDAVKEKGCSIFAGIKRAPPQTPGAAATP